MATKKKGPGLDKDLRSMTESALLGLVSSATHTPRAKVKEILETAGNTALLGAKKFGKAPLAGLGYIKLINRPARTARNPATGATVQVPAKRVLKFAFSKGVKEEMK